MVAEASFSFSKIGGVVKKDELSLFTVEKDQFYQTQMMIYHNQQGQSNKQVKTDIDSLFAVLIDSLS
jgi:hypothetical protein